MFFVLLIALLNAADAQCSYSDFSASAQDVTEIILTCSPSVEMTVDVSSATNTSLAQDYTIAVSFYGWTTASSRISESTYRNQWTVNIDASQPTDPPSSANSMIFFSTSSELATSFLSGPLAWALAAYGQCIETAAVAASLPWGWETSLTSATEVRLRFSPREWGFSLDFVIADEAANTWTDEDQTLFLAALSALYGDNSLQFSMVSVTDGSGGLHLTVQVSGFPTESDESSSFTIASGLSFVDLSGFGLVPQFAHDSGRVCAPGYSDSSGVCREADGCASVDCGEGICNDTPAPGTGLNCN